MSSVTDIDRHSAASRMQVAVLGALTVAHGLNDMMQSLLLAMYPMLKGEFTLSFAQVGGISLTYQLTASILQPLIGLFTDRHPQPFAVSLGMGFTMAGLFALASAQAYEGILLAAALIGLGSAVFHPESSRIARFASGGRHGLGQSLFQIGGNLGGAVGPLLAMAVLLPFGRSSAAWFGAAAIVAFSLLWRVGAWYQRQHRIVTDRLSIPVAPNNALPARTVIGGIAILLVLLFSKYFYLESLDSYYTFYLMTKFHVSASAAQRHLFEFFAAVATGTIAGGAVGDRIGRKRVIWLSILGAAPFTLLLPYADLKWTLILVTLIGLIIASAFSAIVVFAQAMMPNRIGMVSGLFFGLAFGFGGIGAAILGVLADHFGVESVFDLCAYVPLLGAVSFLLPDPRRPRSVTTVWHATLGE
jgi:FSR family fosmidomycin resistance protein-like MFS transporter